MEVFFGGGLGRETFAHLYVEIRDSQSLFMYPKAEAIPKQYWNTTAWNVAWIAADLVGRLTREVAMGNKKLFGGKKAKPFGKKSEKAEEMAEEKAERKAGKK